MPRLRTLVHRVDPYAGFDASGWVFDDQGWYGEHSLFGALVRYVDAARVVEVGSWKGQSSRTLARALQSLGGDRELLCVDTWLGALEFWDDHDDDCYRGLDFRHGYPQVYFQFLANIVHTGLQDWVVPFPTTSVIAARWLRKREIQVDLVYIDASHDQIDVRADLEHYWHVLRPGGVMFGDDFDHYWPGVIAAVEEFAYPRGLKLGVIDDHYWVLQKPPAPPLAELLAALPSS